MASDLIQSSKYTGVKYRTGLDGEKTYYVNYFVNGKSYNKKIGKYSEGIREAFCNIKRAELINEAKNGVVIDKALSFDDLATAYHNTKASIKTSEEMLSRYEYMIKPYFGNKLASKITEDDIYKFQRKLIATQVGGKGRRSTTGSKPMSNSTVNYYVQQVSSILGYGVRTRKIVFNEASNVRMLKEDNARDRYLTKTEMSELVEAVGHDASLLMFTEMSFSTGGRMTAVMNIKAKDINLDDKTVNIEDEKGGGFYRAFLNDEVLSLLDKVMPGLNPNDSIYTMNTRRVQRQMSVILNKLFNVGLDADDAKNRVVIHTLRHTFASQLAIAGAPIFHIQKLLNHKDIKQTLRYAKLAPDSGREYVMGIRAHKTAI